MIVPPIIAGIIWVIAALCELNQTDPMTVIMYEVMFSGLAVFIGSVVLIAFLPDKE